MAEVKSESKVKISKLEIGVSILIENRRWKRIEFISKINGAQITTLFRDEEDIIETGYMITKDRTKSGEQKNLSSYGERRICVSDKDYKKLNEKLTQYERKNAA